MTIELQNREISLPRLHPSYLDRAYPIKNEFLWDGQPPVCNSIAVLCGSVRHEHLFRSMFDRLESLSNCVLMPVFFPRIVEKPAPEILMKLHRLKIDMAEVVVFICPDGMGEPATDEWLYAVRRGKRCLFSHRLTSECCDRLLGLLTLENA